MVIDFPEWEKLINKPFVPLIQNRDRYLLLWGGRGSSKSDCAAKKLIFRCLSEKFFRYLLIRKKYNKVKNSQWQNLKDVANDMGVDHLFTFNKNPVEITCINGNKFIGVGCDDTTSIKSVKDPTGAWYEEDIIDEDDFITITTSIRTIKAKYLQEIFTVNPEVEGTFQDNWFYKRFFDGRVEKSFRDVTEMEVEDPRTGKIKKVEMGYTSHHSTYKDNRYIPAEFVAFLQNMKKTNPYYYTIYCLGEWGNKQMGGLMYKSFDAHKHTTNRAEHRYRPTQPIHAAFDFNVHPFLTMTLWQVYNADDHPEIVGPMEMEYGRELDYVAIQVGENTAEDPHNNTKGACDLFKRDYPNTRAGLFVYGDPNGKKEDTRDEKGRNDYTIIKSNLKDYNPRERVDKSAPAVVQRVGWINSIFGGDKNARILILIHTDCKKTIMDYSFGKEDADGTKLKERVKDKETGITSEKYHHITDANDYFLCRLFKRNYTKYLRGNSERNYKEINKILNDSEDGKKFRRG